MKNKILNSNLLTIGGIIIFQVAIFLPLCLYRVIDGDEGYYLYAAKLILEMKTPYLDFFYTQMPLLPYIYGLWFKLFGITWYSARIFSGIIAILIGILIYLNTKKTTTNWLLSVFSVILYAFSSWAFGWYTVAKTYALSTFFLLISYTCFCHVSKIDSKVKYFLSGFFLGLAINIRIIFGIILFGFIFQIFQTLKNKSQKIQMSANFCIGAILATLPTLFLFLLTPKKFLFGNVGFHILQNSDSLTRSLIQKTAMLFNLLGTLPTSEGASGFQFSIMLLLNIFYFIIIRNEGKRIDFSLKILFLLFIISFVPSPVQNQYFSVLLPYLILNTISLVLILKKQTADFSSKSFFTSAKMYFITLIFLYCIVSPFCAYRYIYSGFNVPGVNWSDNTVNWQIPTVRNISFEIDKNNLYQKPVITSWPGYLLESSSPVLPGLENHFGIIVADKLSQLQKKEYNIISKNDLFNLIDANYLYVLGNYSYSIPILSNNGILINGGCFFPEKAFFRDELIKKGYLCIRQVNAAELYYKRSRER